MDMIFYFVIGIICYLIGFFFGRITKREKKEEKCECFDNFTKIIHFTY